MSVLINNRKRSREDEVVCESTPLSKRINNLHLSNFDEITLFNQQYHHIHDHQQQEQQQQNCHLYPHQQNHHNTPLRHDTHYQQTDALIDSSVNCRNYNNPHDSNMANNCWSHTNEADNSIVKQHSPDQLAINKSVSVRNNWSIDADNSDKNLYNPELSQSENPFYYYKNKLLHELHLERMKRLPI